MIPYAIMGCTITYNMGNKEEIRVLDLTSDTFTFRVSVKVPVTAVENAKQIEIFYYFFSENLYRTILLQEGEFEISLMQAADDEQDGMQFGENECSINRFCHEFRFHTDNALHREYSERVAKEYETYIELKLAGDDAELSRRLTEYPPDAEEFVGKDFDTQLNRWVAESLGDGMRVSEAAEAKVKSFAICLDRRIRYEQYLAMSIEEYQKLYYRENHLGKTMFSGWHVNCLYIGNAFCHHLFPKREQLFRILDKAYAEGIKPVLVFAPVQESRLQDMEDLILELQRYVKDRQYEEEYSCDCEKESGSGGCSKNGNMSGSSNSNGNGDSNGSSDSNGNGNSHEGCGNRSSSEECLEIVVNDWGLAAFIHSIQSKEAMAQFACSLGVLLNKCKKDVRFPFIGNHQRRGNSGNGNPRCGKQRNGNCQSMNLSSNADFMQSTESNEYRRNALNLQEYRHYLREHFSVTRAEYEANPLDYEIVMPASLHLPFFQMNTSMLCPLVAICEHGDRGHQIRLNECKEYCANRRMLYPDRLHMIGVGNTLFGYEGISGNNPKKWESCLQKGVDRIVLNI